MPTVESDKYCETATSRKTWIRDRAVQIKYGAFGTVAGTPSMTIMTMFKKTVQKHPTKLAIAYKESDTWHTINYKEYYEQTRAVAKSLIKLGLQPFQSAAVLGFNSPEYSLTLVGAVFAGGISLGIYGTSTEDGIAYVLQQSQAVVCVVDSEEQLFKVLQIWDQVPNLKAIVKYFEPPDREYKDVYTWKDFMALGEDVPDEILEKRMADQYVNKCCKLMFTSGTTGHPKAVMLSHDNIIYTVQRCAQMLRLRETEEVLVSYLPLCHISGQILDIYMPIYTAAAVYFAQRDALKGSLTQTLNEVQPTIFVGVPRLFEKIQDKIMASLDSLHGLKKKLITWARGKSSKSVARRTFGQEPPLTYRFARIILAPIRKKIGLTRCRQIYSVAAPLPLQCQTFFSSIDLPLGNVYGLSELSGATLLSLWIEDNKHWAPGSAGYPILGFGATILNPDEEGKGEIAMFGRHVFMGYLNDAEKTKSIFDSKHRLLSGDVGYVDKRGLYYICGRMNELITLSNGDSVHPVAVETDLKAALPVCANCQLIGNGKSYLSILITFKAEVNMDSMEPTEYFTPQTITWCQSIGSKATKVSDVLNRRDPAVTKAIEDVITELNKNNQYILKFAILPLDFSIKGGELGPTMKLKRHAVKEKYKDLISRLYR